MSRTEVTPLFEEPERTLIPPLRSGALAWQTGVHRVLKSNATRFDGREDITGTRGMQYLVDCATLLTHHDDARVYVQTITRVRWAAVRSLLKIEPNRNLTRVKINQAVAVVRELHNRVITAAEVTAVE